MAGAEGIEIPVTVNPDGTVTGFDEVIAGIERVKQAASAASEELDKMEGRGGGGDAGAGGAPEPGAFWETRMGQFGQSVLSAGLTFVERSLPQILDPTKSTTEKALSQAPLAARLAAQEAAGVALGAAQTELAGTGVELPPELERQIMQVAGVFAEEAAKNLTAELRAELTTARAGAQQTLQPFFELGVTPDQQSIEQVIDSFRQLGKRQHAGERLIAEAIDGAFAGELQDGAKQVLNGPSGPDVQGIIDRFVDSIPKAAGGG